MLHFAVGLLYLCRGELELFHHILGFRHRLGDIRPHLGELAGCLIDAGKRLPEILELSLELVGFVQHAVKGAAHHAELQQGFHFLSDHLFLVVLQGADHMQHRVEGFRVVQPFPFVGASFF